MAVACRGEHSLSPCLAVKQRVATWQQALSALLLAEILRSCLSIVLKLLQNFLVSVKCFFG